ncbi:MAG: hypothetical protein HGA69_00800, partial [Desulfobulbaceae bacterium]|nr:hypothetical protein [Desulfobulbaceae bacterium]
MAIIMISGCWGLLACFLVGIGLSFTRNQFSQELSGRDFWLAFWAGFTAVIAWLQVWHLFYPVNEWAFFSVVLLSLPGWWRFGKKIRAWFLESVQIQPRFLSVLLILVLYLAHRASGPPIGDACVYLHNIAWNHNFGIIPGAARPLVTLGFNLSSYLWAAVLEIGPWEQHSYHLCNGVLIAVIAGRSLLALWRLLNSGVNGWRMSSVTDRYYAVLAVPICSSVFSLLELRISSTDTDTTVAMAAFALAGEWVRLWEKARDHGHKSVAGYDMIWVTGLASLLVTLKLSAAPLAILCIVLSWYWWLKGGKTCWSEWSKPFFGAAIVASVLVLPWLLRSTILSGYPLFPSTIIRIPMPWALSPEMSAFPIVAFKEILFDKPLFHQLMPGYTHWIFPYIFWQATRSPELILLPTFV